MSGSHYWRGVTILGHNRKIIGRELNKDGLPLFILGMFSDAHGFRVGHNPHTIIINRHTCKFNKQVQRLVNGVRITAGYACYHPKCTKMHLGLKSKNSKLV